MIWDTLYIKSMNIEKLIDRGKFADEYSLNYVLLKKMGINFLWLFGPIWICVGLTEPFLNLLRIINHYKLLEGINRFFTIFLINISLR